MGVAWFLAWLLGTAALHKARNAEHYQRLMGKYLSGLPVGPVLVWLVAAIELSLALAMLLPQTQRAGLVGTSFLLLAYACMMSVQLARGRADMKCGCAGPASDTTISPTLVLRNLACAVLALLATTPTISMDAGVAGIGLALFVAAFAALIYLGSEQLIANGQQMAGER
jgi:uncharacterized membrane protein